MNALYETTLKLLADVMPEKTLRLHLDEGLSRLGANENTVEAEQLFKVLRAGVYRAMQLNLPASNAKTRVQQAINQLTRQAAAVEETKTRHTLERQAAVMPVLEEAVRRFNFYFEWPEVQRFRSQLAVIRDEHALGHSAPNLIRDAQTQLEALERRLQDGLALQAREIADLRSDLERVQSIGGLKVRRLQSALADIERAHEQGALAPAEIERARKLGLELRRLVESSIVPRESLVSRDDNATPKSIELVLEDRLEDLILDTEFELEFPSGSLALSPEAIERLRDLDLAEQARVLRGLAQEYPNELGARPDLSARLSALNAENAARELSDLDVKGLLDDLQASRPRLLEHNRQLQQELQIKALAFAEAGLDTREFSLGLSVAERTLAEGNPAVEDLAVLETQVIALERMAAQRESAQNEEDARRERAMTRQTAFITGMRERRRLLSARPAESTRAPNPNEDLLVELTNDLDELEAEHGLGRVRDDLANRVSELAAALDPRAQESAELLDLRARLNAIPDEAALSARVALLQSALDAASQTPDDGEARRLLDAAQEQAADVLREAGALQNARLSALQARVRDLNLEGFAELQAAEAATSAGAWPNLNPLEQELQVRWEAALRQRARELQELEAAYSEYAPVASEIPTKLVRLREGLQIGALVDLREAWTDLEALRAHEIELQAEWRRRAQAVVSERRSVTSLGGETAANLLRAIDVLSADLNMGSVSPETRLRMEVTLGEAERAMAEVRHEIKAAQDVVAALRNHNAIDDLLGVLSGADFLGAPEPPRATQPMRARVACDEAPVTADADARLNVNPELRAWLDAFAAEPGVGRLALFDARDMLVSGRVEQPQRLVALLRRAEAAGSEMAQELRRRPPRLQAVECQDGALIVLFLRPGLLVIYLDDAALYARVVAMADENHAKVSLWSRSA